MMRYKLFSATVGVICHLKKVKVAHTRHTYDRFLGSTLTNRAKNRKKKT